jgi:hypothetical protein
VNKLRVDGAMMEPPENASEEQKADNVIMRKQHTGKPLRTLSSFVGNP